MSKFLKTIITVFLLVAISFAFASASHAMSVDQHLITGSDPNGYSGCAMPPTKTAFSPTDARVYSWMFISNAFFMDVVTWKWYSPDNSLYASHPYTPGLIGSACVWGYMDISGRPPSSKTGTWKVEIYSGSTLAATDTFTIGNPPCTYSYSAWGACQPDGTQERTITSSSPAGCIAWLPQLTQACTYVPPTCTYTFSAWGPCQPNGTQERTITSSSPAGCIAWLPQLTQACTYVPPALSAPKNLNYTFSNNILTINWDSVAGAAGYKLGLGTQAGKYDIVNDLGNTIQIGPVDVRTAAPGTYTFYLAVKAYTGSQESSYSNEIFLSITVAGPSIEAPKNLRYSTQGNMMTILWDAVSGATGYKVGIGVQSSSYLGPYDLGKATQIGPFDAAGVASGTYYLAAKAYKDKNESAYSNEIAITIAPARYTFSDDQKGLIVKFGNPQYLTLLFNSSAQRREEIWVFTGQKKMYTFWDGMRVSEDLVTVDPAIYSKPPSLDPSLFTKDTSLQDIARLVGVNYVEIDQSSLSSIVGAIDSRSNYFADKGLYVSFVDNRLVVVKTTDIPKGK